MPGITLHQPLDLPAKYKTSSVDKSVIACNASLIQAYVKQNVIFDRDNSPVGQQKALPLLAVIYACNASLTQAY